MMVKHTLVLSTLLFAFDANASCTIDAPEVGDIGPSSELVCHELESRFPASTLAVESRNIHSPEKVSVRASVNGEPVTLGYELAGFAWSPTEGGPGADNDLGPNGLSLR